MDREPAYGSGRREVAAGLERYTFYLHPVAVQHMVESAKGSKEVLNMHLVGHYTLSPRPDPRDILSSTVRLLNKRWAEVEIVIKRGHYTLLAYLSRHRDIEIVADHMTCSCHPGEIQYLLRDTLPDYGREFDETLCEEGQSI